MYTIKVKNVNEALIVGSSMLSHDGVKVYSRGMETLEYPTPVCTTYTNPKERVLLLDERDANPFFHLFESLWILAGRQDVYWLAKFNKRMKEYSDDGINFHAAYGYRLRTELGFDQISAAINLLRTTPDTRQCVLQIWNASSDLGSASKDIPCNDIVMLKIRNDKLNMAVCNRSNDMIWGAYGANVVQFSMLQEYIADKVGVEVGVYNQVSDSFHVYPDNPQWDYLKTLSFSDFNPYKYDVKTYPLNAQERNWDNDLLLFCSLVDSDEHSRVTSALYSTAYFRNVVVPMYKAWAEHRQHNNGLEYTGYILADDWRTAAYAWLLKRETS